jgi:predicted nuclease with RNAse H fold/dephospho-CoA kinase
VTFNGTIFDLKFLRKELPQLQLPKGHVDLRFFGRPVGLKGPQKKIEIDIGFKRESDLEGVTGERAPLLWHEYLLGDLESAKTLIEYNFADIEGMRRILDVALERLSKTERIPDDVIDSAGFSKKQPRLRFASSERTHSKNRIFIPRYSGRKGPAITLRRLRLNNRGKNLSIVGIDLTGSEARPTGWCHLQGGKAVTKVISKTRDLIEETMATNPDIVSIDSPLSLPKGRRSAFDDDPGRNEFGIMRGCERTLKRRGVNVYPALIPSMQRLTQRGMRLAQSFRKLGVPVIESYPGAAQDIMGIPRKSSGLDYLKKGLKDFGVRGEFLKQKVTHDEVDAVTSAVVGLFFWAGKFEALGNEEEEYLIIPDLAAKPETWLNRVVVGISGPIAAGKTTAGKHMSDKGFVYGRYSQVLEYTLRERGQPVNRTTLQKLGERFHRNPGQRWLSRRLIGQLPVDKDLVIDGLRWPEDHAFMVETFGPAFFHLHLNASDSVRENRYLQRGGTKDDFEAASVHRVEAKVPHLAMRADHTIENEMTLKGFTRTISRAISTVIKEIGE